MSESTIEHTHVDLPRTGGAVRVVLDRERAKLALTFGFWHEGKFIPKRDEFIDLARQPFLWHVFQPGRGWDKKTLEALLD